SPARRCRCATVRIRRRLATERRNHEDCRAQTSEAKTMKAVRLHIRGEFDDAFIYMGRLLLLTADRSLLFVRLGATLDAHAKGRARRVLRLLFERNDMMHAKGLIKAAGSASNSNRELSRLTNEELH